MTSSTTTKIIAEEEAFIGGDGSECDTDGEAFRNIVQRQTRSSLQS